MPGFGDAVRWGWISPLARVAIPDRYFTSWVDYPILSTPHEIEDEDVWAHLLWYSAGAGNGFLFRHLGLTGAWFLHPLDRPGALREHLRAAQELTPLPEASVRQHPNGLKYFPWIDYFPYWKAYELIDVMENSDICTVWATDETEKFVSAIHEDLERHERYTRAWMGKAQRKWRDRRQVFQYLASYRAMRAALIMAPEGFPPSQEAVEGWNLDRAAQVLADRMNITANNLEAAVADQLLEQVHEWTDEWQGKEGPGPKAIGQLQKDVACAVEWLCLLTGRDVDDYYDRWTSTGHQSSTKATLSAALPLDFRVAEDFFLEHFSAVQTQ